LYVVLLNFLTVE